MFGKWRPFYLGVNVLMKVCCAICAMSMSDYHDIFIKTQPSDAAFICTQAKQIKFPHSHLLA